ncbi:MAG TPA: class I adenylate-forming enzyme family protein, partial [Stellaceae bacterium]|nr:class I adenylate-forming enzyme family protein [Stellaceae bacterium]
MTVLTFGELVRRNGRSWSGKDAFVELDRRVSWGEFDARTDALGHALRALGVRPGDRVAMLAPDCIETAELFIACAKIGAIRVGLNARLAAPEIAALVKDSEPHLLFVRADYRPLLAPVDSGGPMLIGFGGSHGLDRDYEELIARHRRDGELAQTPVDIVMIAYTTGSTGLPKGAIYPHGRFLASILYTALYEGIMHDSIWLHAMPAAGIPIMHM